MSKKDSIRVSENHGLNATLGICPWCGKDSGEIGLLGRLPDDKKAPWKCVFSLDPCAKCQENMALGITLVEAIDKPTEGWVQLTENLYTRFRWLVVSDDSIQAFIADKEMAEHINKTKKAFIHPEAFELMISRTGQLEDSAKEEQENG